MNYFMKALILIGMSYNDSISKDDITIAEAFRG